MFAALRLQAPNPAIELKRKPNFAGKLNCRHSADVRIRPRVFTSVSLQLSEDVTSEPSAASQFTSSVGSPPILFQLSHWTLRHRHITLLNVIACVTGVSATWLFCSAIPTLWAFKTAAESLEKLFDVTREELPDTMAAVRLSGMEISDLTMELSDLGQEITRGVRSSTRAVRIAEERLRRLTNVTPTATMQELRCQNIRTAEPAVATTAKLTREGIVKGRAILQMLFTITRISSLYWKTFYDNE
ncbi:hypothetical protein Nepgr_008476 [Nepenthes gracilis]|uniref:Uncharacterized protein n=1 Tax=Nepenthes gracilis TaxID=150966 RepID=A0AAD3S9U3_NEPGR|nr:hypothetical protein Nepgr_008476 [Nepenthes gracilis]